MVSLGIGFTTRVFCCVDSAWASKRLTLVPLCEGARLRQPGRTYQAPQLSARAAFMTPLDGYERIYSSCQHSHRLIKDTARDIDG